MRNALAKAIKTTRKARGLTQEDFSHVSSRTYVSTLERGQKNPTLDKLEAISKRMNIHLISLLTLAHLSREKGLDLEKFLEQIRDEINQVLPKNAP